MLKKLSLAALVAMGSMSVASATTDLSSAIKGVTISGYLRYRYTQDHSTYQGNINTKTGQEANSDSNTKDANEYKAVLKVGFKASDTLSVHGSLVWLDSYASNNNDTGTEQKNPFNVRAAYLKYSANGVNVKAGQQYLATPLTDHDDDLGNGVLATDTISGVTLAGAYFNSIFNAAGTKTEDNNVYVLAAIANVGPANLQAWYYNVSSSADNGADNNGYYDYFLQAAANCGPVAVKTQYAAGKGTDQTNGTKKKNQRFFAIAATGKIDVATVTAAYLHFGHDGSAVVVGTKNADALIAAGDILTDVIQQKTTSLQDGAAVALVASAKVMDKTTVGVQYVNGESNDAANAQNTTFAEYDLDAAYQYNKKLKFSGYYAIFNQTVGGQPTVSAPYGTQSQREARFEAKYSF